MRKMNIRLNLTDRMNVKSPHNCQILIILVYVTLITHWKCQHFRFAKAISAQFPESLDSYLWTCFPSFDNIINIEWKSWRGKNEKRSTLHNFLSISVQFLVLWQRSMLKKMPKLGHHVSAFRWPSGSAAAAFKILLFSPIQMTSKIASEIENFTVPAWVDRCCFCPPTCESKSIGTYNFLGVIKCRHLRVDKLLWIWREISSKVAQCLCHISTTTRKSTLKSFVDGFASNESKKTFTLRRIRVFEPMRKLRPGQTFFV